MTSPHSPEAPRDPRGASSWARRVNAETAEWLAAYCRVSAIAWAALMAVAVLALIWWPSWATALTAVLAVLWLAAHVGLGFYALANPEWKDPDDGEADE